MNTLRGVVRFLIGVTLLFSGFVKIIDPVGSGLIMSEYLKFLHLSFLDFGAVFGASLLSALEMLTGIVLLTGFRIKIAIAVSLGLISFFTILTLFLAIFNPILDCGCFGEAIKLTNIETFLKNLILLLFALFLFFQRNNFVAVAPARVEWIFTAVFASMVLTLSIYSHYNLPIVDFLKYRAGYDLNDEARQTPNGTATYITKLIYVKNGVKKEFEVNNLPDSTWTFLDSKSTIINGAKNEINSSYFAVSDAEGQYITDSIIGSKGPVFIFSILKSEKLSSKDLKEINSNLSKLKEYNVKTILITSSLIPEVTAKLKSFSINEPLFFTDFKTLVAMNRSNTGIIYLNEGVIVKKWVLRRFDKVNLIKLLADDPELISAEVNIRQQVNVEIVAVLFIVFLLLMKFVFKLIFIKKMTYYANRIEEEFEKS